MLGDSRPGTTPAMTSAAGEAEEPRSIPGLEDIMKANHGILGALAGIGLVVLAAGAADAGGRGRPRDVIYRSAALDGHQLATVAVLPVVAVADNPIAEQQVEAGWVTLYGGASVQWMPADEARARFAACPDGRGKLEAAIRGQIWSRGSVDSPTAIRLARLLGVDAVLCVRVERWDVPDRWHADVEMSAVLIGADGRPLWSIQGGVVEGRAVSEPALPHPLDPGAQGRRLGTAFCRLMARWADALPTEFENGFPEALTAYRGS